MTRRIAPQSLRDWENLVAQNAARELGVFDVGSRIDSTSLSREDRVQLFGEPIAALLDSPVLDGPTPKPLRVLAVNRETGVVTFGEDTAADQEAALVRACDAAELPGRLGTMWLPRCDYEKLVAEVPGLPPVVGAGCVVRLDQDGAHAED